MNKGIFYIGSISRRALWVCAWVCMVSNVVAFEVMVREGDTLAGLAQQLYGRVENEQVLVAANQLASHGGIAIRAGMRLEIPAVSYYRVQGGDRWPELAERLLGGRHRAAVLAFANDSKPWLFPPRDAEVVVPYNMRYVGDGGDTLPGLASRFYGDQKRAWMLQHYNQMEGVTLERGQLVLLPLSQNLGLTEAGKQAAAEAAERLGREAAGTERKRQLEVEAELPRWLADLRAARYIEAVARGTRFLHRARLTAPQRAQIQRGLAEAFVALDAPRRAAQACRAWLQEDRRARLDPHLVSPKLLSACRGHSTQRDATQ